MNPLLAREIGTRWRDGRAFTLIFILTVALALLFAWVYGAAAPPNAASEAQFASSARWSMLGHSLFASLAWLQTLAWLLISPSLTSSAIAYERERGWFDALLLSPLLPREIVFGKWLGALAYAATLYLVALPFLALTLLLGGVSPLEFWLILGLHAGCACLGSSLGLAASAWSFRASAALRSANGLIFVWLFGSLASAIAVGETPFGLRLLGAFTPFSSPFLVILGRTNPILRALEITSASPAQRWPLCFAFLLAATLLFLAIAIYCVRQPLAEAPFIQKPKKTAKTVPTHAQIPLVTRLRFANPVLDREVRAKFVMRQPPLGVILAEATLAILVAGFYVRTLLWALFEPRYRPIIWWGLIFTSLIVAMMAAATMGSNGLSRERERGTWEGVRLSLLRPDEILRGKVGSSLLACVFFSLPVWPLLLPCIDWTRWNRASPAIIAPLQAASCLLVWGATTWSYTLVGLWVGRRQTRSSRAAGRTVGLLGAVLLLLPALLALSHSKYDDLPILGFLSSVHPLFAVGLIADGQGLPKIFGTGLPYAAFHLVFGLGMWGILRRALRKELARGE